MRGQRWPNRALDALFDYGPALPLTITGKSKQPSVRVLGLLWHFVWFLPAALVCMVPILALMLVCMFSDAWYGE